jgi:DNA-binding NarL/FixJ family response regulator
MKKLFVARPLPSRRMLVLCGWLAVLFCVRAFQPGLERPFVSGMYVYLGVGVAAGAILTAGIRVAKNPFLDYWIRRLAGPVGLFFCFAAVVSSAGYAYMPVWTLLECMRTFLLVSSLCWSSCAYSCPAEDVDSVRPFMSASLAAVCIAGIWCLGASAPVTLVCGIAASCIGAVVIFRSLACPTAAIGGMLAGLFFFNTLTKVVPVEMLVPDSFGWAIVVAIMACAVLLGFVPASRTDPEDTKDGLSERLESMGLSSREIEATVLLVEGCTSDQAAERLGVKSPTVRTYHRRVYAKLGVADSTELVRLLADQKVENASGQAADRRVAHPFLSKIMYLSALVGLATLCFPLLLPAGTGGPYAPEPMAIAWGLIAAGLFRFHPTELKRIANIVVSIVGSGSLFLILWLQSGALHMADAVDLARFFSYFAAVLFLVWCVDRFRRQFETMNAMVVAAVLGVSVVVETFLFPYDPVLSCACGFICALGGCIFEPGSSFDSCDQERKDILVDVGFAACGAGFGLVLAAVWDYVAVLDALTFSIPFIIVVCLGAVCYTVCNASDAAWLRLAYAMVCFLFIYLMVDVAKSIILVAAILFAAIAGWAFSRSHTSPGAFFVIAAGISIWLSAYCLAAFSDVYARALPVATVAEGLRVAAGILLGVIELVAAGGFFYVLWQEHAERSMDLFVEDMVGRDARLDAYLFSRGLNELQRAVCMGIARGESGREISERLNYSMGAVSGARTTAYRLLGIHSRAGLVELLKDIVEE